MPNDLFYKPASAWEIYGDPQSRERIQALAKKYLDFLSHCKTERETVEYAAQRLEEAGFSQDFNDSDVYRVLRGKALFAARRGNLPLEEGLLLIGAHCDSPRLDFKQHPFVEQAGVVQAKTHYYGGIRKYQWLARPLALHGVIITGTGKKVPVSLGETPGEPVFCVADLLPHLAQKQAGQKLSEAFEGEKLNIILGHEPELSGEEGEDREKEAIKSRLLDLLYEKYGVVEEDFITAELEAVPAGPARFTGLDQAMLGGYGQDDRICVFCALEAILDAGQTNNNIAVMFWDKEEIGSDGATGASSRFLEYCVAELAQCWEPQLTTGQVLLASRALSADVTAALDPDYQDVHEKQNAARLGYGPCFSKFTGSRGKYEANDADAEYFAELRQLLNASHIPWQAAELGKVDLGGGGTIAKFLAAQGMRIIDLGPALLSMHSPFELSSAVDLYATKKAFQAFLDC